MPSSPAGWPQIAAGVYYRDPARAIDWLCEAFGFEVRLKVEGEGGRIEHSELTYGQGLVMVGGETSSGRPDATHRKSPRSVGGANTQSMMMYVDDVEAHCARAKAAGAVIVSPPKTTDYGAEYQVDRGYEAEDIDGHHWFFYQRLRDAPK